MWFTSRGRTQVNETACSGEKGQLWSSTIARKSQLWLYDGNGFFDLLFLAVVTIIIHNGLLQRTLTLCMHGLVTQSWLMLCDPMDCSPPESSVHGILQARILEWVLIFSSKGSSWPRDQTHISCISCTGRQILYHCTTWKALLMIKANPNTINSPHLAHCSAGPLSQQKAAGSHLWAHWPR